jgi:chromosome segregation ATPase
VLRAFKLVSYISFKRAKKPAREGEIMRGFVYIGLVLLLVFPLLTHCETTRGITNSITGGHSSMDELFAQVPAEDRSQVEEAIFHLQVAEEKMKLAEMKSELASLQEKHADYAKDVASKYRDEAEISVDLAKMETIYRAGLGEKEKNINEIADLKAEKLEIQAARVKLEAKRDTTEQRINDLIKQIDEQEIKIANLKAAGVAAPEPVDLTEPGEEPEDVESGKIKPEEPSKEAGEEQETSVVPQ